MTTPLYLLPKVRSQTMRDSANGQQCSIRIASFIPGRRCSGQDTSVFCHIPNFTKGMSTKGTDMAAEYGCYACHDIIDGRDPKAWKYLMENYPAAVLDRMLNGLVETHCRMIEQGIIVVPDGELV